MGEQGGVQRRRGMVAVDTALDHYGGGGGHINKYDCNEGHQKYVVLGKI